MSCGGDLAEIYLGNSVYDKIIKAYRGNTVIFERGGGLDPITQGLLDQATIDGFTPFSSSVQDAADTLFKTLRTAGIIDILDLFYVMATDGDSDFGSYNVLDPGGTFDLTQIDSPIFTSLQGFERSGTTSILDTNWIASSHATNYQLNSAHTSVYVRSNAAFIGGSELGVVGDNNGTITTSTSTFFDPDANTLRINSSNVARRTSTVRTVGEWIVNRNGAASADLTLNLNGVSTATIERGGSPISTFVPDVYSLYLLGLNNKGVLNGSTPSQISIVTVGGDMTGLETDLYNAIQTYMTTLGTEV